MPSARPSDTDGYVWTYRRKKNIIERNVYLINKEQTLLFVSTNRRTLQKLSTIWDERKTRRISNGNDDVLNDSSISPVYGLNVRTWVLCGKFYKNTSFNRNF